MGLLRDSPSYSAAVPASASVVDKASLSLESAGSWALMALGMSLLQPTLTGSSIVQACLFWRWHGQERKECARNILMWLCLNVEIHAQACTCMRVCVHTAHPHPAVLRATYLPTTIFIFSLPQYYIDGARGSGCMLLAGSCVCPTASLVVWGGTLAFLCKLYSISHAAGDS